MNETRKPLLSTLEATAREIAGTLGLEIVDLVFHSRGKHSLLRIDVDRPGPVGVGLRDCEALSRALDDHLERLELFDAPFELQVSSPGIDRPIRSTDDIRRNTGRAVRVEFRAEGERIQEVTGILQGAGAEGHVEIVDGGRRHRIDRDRIVLMKQTVTTGGRGRDKG